MKCLSWGGWQFNYLRDTFINPLLSQFPQTVIQKQPGKGWKPLLPKQFVEQINTKNQMSFKIE